MTARILPKEEWARLVGTEAETMWPYLTELATVIVVEEAGEIIGCQVLQPVLHAEGMWIREDHRKRGGVGRKLWPLVKKTALDVFGVEWMATGCASAEVEHLLEHVGAVKLPDHYMIPLRTH